MNPVVLSYIASVVYGALAITLLFVLALTVGYERIAYTVVGVAGLAFLSCYTVTLDEDWRTIASALTLMALVLYVIASIALAFLLALA